MNPQYDFPDKISGCCIVDSLARIMRHNLKVVTRDQIFRFSCTLQSKDLKVEYKILYQYIISNIVLEYKMVIEIIPKQNEETILDFIRCLEEISLLHHCKFNIKLCIFISSQSLNDISYLISADHKIHTSAAEIYYQLPSDNYNYIRQIYKFVVGTIEKDDNSAGPIIEFSKIVFENNNFILKIGKCHNKIKIINHAYQFPPFFEKLLMSTRTKFKQNTKNRYSLVDSKIVQIFNSYSSNNYANCKIKVNNEEIILKMKNLVYIDQIKIYKVNFFSNINLSILSSIKFPVYWESVNFNGYEAFINLSNSEVMCRGKSETLSLWRELLVEGFAINFQH